MIHLQPDLSYRQNASNVCQNFWPVSMDPGAVLNRQAGERGRPAGKICTIPGAERGREIPQILKADAWNGKPRVQTTCRISGTDLCRQALACQSSPGHRVNLYDLRVCLASSSCLRPESSLTLQTVTIKPYFTISAFKSKQKKLKEHGIENSAVVAPAVVWRRLKRRTFENNGEECPISVGGRQAEAAWDLQKSFP